MNDTLKITKGVSKGMVEVPAIKIGAPKIHYIADCFFSFLKLNRENFKSKIKFDDVGVSDCPYTEEALGWLRAFEYDCWLIIELARKRRKLTPMPTIKETLDNRKKNFLTDLNETEALNLLNITNMLLYMGGIDSEFNYWKEYKKW